jgi:uncharacterized protein (DUF2249 family)
MDDMITLDVRNLIPMARHAKILKQFDELVPGASLELINDHQPEPLYYYFLFQRRDQFSWTYLEEGPEVWRVQIRKTA